jgi:hypothetical protein
VLVSFSPDAGARFLSPLRLDHVKPAGRFATQLLHDGAMLVSWVDVDGRVWLRRITPGFAASERLQLAESQNGRAKGFPRTALLRDYHGDNSEARLLVAFTRDASPALRTLLVSIPEGQLLEAERSCDCAPTAEQLRGIPVRGTIIGTSSSPGGRNVRVSHFAVPGIFDEGVREFSIGPELAGSLPVGRQFLGRVDQRDREWWLFDVRLIASAPKP